MEREHEEHLGRIMQKLVPRIQEKYRDGQLKHQTRLWEADILQLANEALNEALDQVVYIYTLIEQLEKDETGV